MGNAWKWIVLAGLGSLAMGQSVFASDINPMKQHHDSEKLKIQEIMKAPVVRDEARQSDARALGRELLLTGQGVTEEMKRNIGELAVEDAQARVIENIPINKARTTLVSTAGDYEAMKMRYHMRSQMLPAWEQEKARLLNELAAAGSGKTAAESEKAAMDKAYEAAYKAREKVVLFYQGEFDPDQLAPYKKTSDQTLETLHQAAVLYALHSHGFHGSTASPEVMTLANQYAKTMTLAMDDEIQVKLLGKRLGQVKADYEKATLNYEKLYAKEISRCSNSGNGILIPNGNVQAVSVATAGGASAVTGNTGSGVPTNPGILPRSKEERDDLRKDLQQKMDALYSEDLSRLAARRVQYANELEDLGYFDKESSTDQSMVQTQPLSLPEKKFRIDGEARVDYGAHHGEETIGDRARARVRIYGDLNLDDNWHFISMLENEKILSGRGDDNWMDIDRYYLTGKVGSTRVDAGAFGSYLAEGNIYDSKFTGVRVTGETPFSYMAEAGTTSQTGFAAALEASKPFGIYTLGAGLYRFDMESGGQQRNIYMVNLHRPLGLYDFGAMGLLGEDKTKSDKGYVFTLARGEDRTWERGNTYYFLKYYHQPYTTYVSHTMEGMADYMHGFKGFGGGIHYTVAPNWLLQGEYYSLKDLENGANNHTIWVALSYYFSNYISN
ncbi:MAG TPA: hypothetical protein DDY92_05260 [Dialister sp.]|nr:hypothetical protein [Dialister sp.]